MNKNTISPYTLDSLKYELTSESALAVYVVLPICLLIIIYDYLLGNGVVISSLPENPSSLALYNMLFGLPHIIAGHSLVLNKEHRGAHRKNILLGSFLVIMTIVTASYLLPLYVNLTAFIIITLVHVLRQQFGLVKVFSSVGGVLVDLWTWLAIGVVGTLAFVFAAKAQLDPDIIKISYILVYLLNICFVVLGFFLYRKVVSTKGKYFFLVNLLSVPLATFFYFSGYTFFAILTIRVIHDTTAFMIYLVHDKNKNWSKLSKLNAGFISFFTVVLFSIALAFILENYLIDVIVFFTKSHLSYAIMSTITLSVIVYIEMMHYYLESKIWKNSSSCRKYVRFNVQ